MNNYEKRLQERRIVAAQLLANMLASGDHYSWLQIKNAINAADDLISQLDITKPTCGHRWRELFQDRDEDGYVISTRLICEDCEERSDKEVTK